MIVYSTGLDANPETLIGRARHIACRDEDIETEVIVKLDGMYDNVFGRHDEEGNRLPYPFHEVVKDLVDLGLDIRDWTGSEVKSIIPMPGRGYECHRYQLTFQSRTSPTKATVKVANHMEAVKFTQDMEASGLWLLVSWETPRRPIRSGTLFASSETRQ